MLRPERMSKVSVTGTKAVMGDVIETVHDLNLVHFRDYDGRWSGFETGDPIEGAESASEMLVTVRSLESILDVDEDDAGPARIVTEDALADQLADVRAEVNELDDRRQARRDELRSVEERIGAVEPFADLGIDLDLLSGYDRIDVAVGEADADAVERALADADGIREYEVFGGDRTAAAFAYPAAGADDPLDDALVGVDFTPLEVPDAEGSPEAYVEELEHERQRIESRLDGIENEIDELRLEHGGFLLAAEERLTIEVQKTEAPLQFATTDHAFVAEGWIPADEYGRFAEAIRSAVGERADVEELERASYTPTHGHSREAVDEDSTYDAGEDGEVETVPDGGHAEEDTPPVVQDNPGPVRPFELLVETINRPRYFEIDPTVILFLTFPAFFGFMIGDLGYGLLYMGLGYWLYRSFDSPALRSLGGIAVWAGGFTALFGVLYGEIFGLHLISEYLWQGALGLEHAPIQKGLHTIEFARLWLTLSLVVGLLHLGVGYLFGFLNDRRAHGLRDAVMEDLGPLLLMLGVGVWIFSDHLQGEGGPRPSFLFEVFSGDPLGFTGFSAGTGIVGLLVALVGFVLLVAGEGAVGLLESPTYALVNVLSYTRIAAVLLAKAGMAFVVNLLVFGAYEHHEEVHFMLDGHAAEGAEVLFPGLVHAGIGGVIGGILVLLVGHLLVLALGVTSAGLQAVRLEYVEFFGKFYDGGGEKYEPFGYQRTYTTED